jgi:hypothetical protein
MNTVTAPFISAAGLPVLDVWLTPEATADIRALSPVTSMDYKTCVS